MSNVVASLDLDELLLNDREAALAMANLNWNPEDLPADVQVTHMHYNKPQLRSMMVGANVEYAVWGRGTGKSEGLISPRTKRNVEVMPQGHGCFVGATYLQLLERTLPPVVKGWEAMGWKRDRDFWIRKTPPKSLNVPQPIVGPLTPEHCIFFRNGAVASLVSQDRPGSANGKTVHWIAGDEAKFLDKKALDNELLMTNRGDDQYFGGIPEFHSMLFCTDMPTWKSAMWILEMEDKMKPERVELLKGIQVEIFKLWQKYLVYEGRKKAAIFNQIRQYQKYWDEIRANTTYFSEASTWENVEGFGRKNILAMKERLPKFIYRTAILNMRPGAGEEDFYPHLNDRHLYDAYDYGHLDKLEFGTTADDCRKDADLDPGLPLHTALDYGAHINNVATGQLKGFQRFDVISGMDVLQPQRLKDLAKRWCDYYEPHRRTNNIVYYYYDHTALQGNAISEFNYADEWIALVSKRGWKVKKIYLGRTPAPKSRYEMWGDLLQGKHAKIRAVRFNRNNCNYLLESMRGAKVKAGTKNGEYEKNKADERNPELDQRTTTHYSDAADTLLWGVTTNQVRKLSGVAVVTSS
ncbi:hypothetical protein GCM10027275_24930 [Rhabdobacter roseus]|uniref:Uncharacterized protein n=1 Tax=Rhabdobacter roseus TaxID=1655419 RepID=A0A840TT38_9BACT|nr:hypothetical protein [Rhabdobacter roseus]MBB5284433.1 hypothetical protein [Rhabdobacter roseus]